MRVHIHLSAGFSMETWTPMYGAGLKPDESPYGYHHLSRTHFVTWSCDGPESRIMSLFRRFTKALLGFDFQHAWRNRHHWKRADVIITHTEYESIAVSAVRKLVDLFSLGRATQPRLIAQSVWTADRWERLGPVRRWLHRALLVAADHRVTLSPLNAERLEEILSARPVNFVPFGISTESFPTAAPVMLKGKPFRLLAIGNDVHRDWETLRNAQFRSPEYRLTVASRSSKARCLKEESGARICTPVTAAEVLQLYGESNIVIVPLHKNLHASGITVVLEAVSLGKPVVCARAGGIEAYFDHDEVMYYEVGNAESLRAAVKAMCDPVTASRYASKAQFRFSQENYSSAGYSARILALAVGNDPHIGD